jgi:hypothetical protein
MLLDGNTILTAKSLSGPVSASHTTNMALDSRPDAFNGRRSGVRVDDSRIRHARSHEYRSALKPADMQRESFRQMGRVRSSCGIHAFPAPLHVPSRIERLDAPAPGRHSGRVLPGRRSESCSALNRNAGAAAKSHTCALSYFSLTLCCVTPCSGWHGGHATLQSAETGVAVPEMDKPVGSRRDRISSCRVRPWSRHLASHLPSVARALKLCPSWNGNTNLGRLFVQGQIGPIDCKEEMGRRSFDSVRTCGSKGCEKRLRREGRVQPRPSHLFTIRLRPVLP